MEKQKRISRKIDKSVDPSNTPGIRMDPGPHIGIVKHVVDSTRTGRISVYLPHLGGDPEDVHNQRIIQYASPFFGHTNLQINPNGKPNTHNEFDTVRHSYGMWMTPPDIGVKVLVIFETGDANSGYWFACLPPSAEHNMVGTQGGATTEQLAKDDTVDPLIEGYEAEYAPAVEFNAASFESATPGVLTTSRPPHRIQTKILAEQGTLADNARGIDDANTTRESPSGIFGITTPGRNYEDQVTDDLLQRTTESPVPDITKLKERVEYGRKGGHQFTMDDGDVYGEQRRIKMRSAAGHQIIMDDTEGFMYISNSTGTTWLELTNDGQIFIYAKDDISMRCGNDLNLKVDNDLNIEVDNDLNLKVRNHIKTETKTREEVVFETKDVRIDGHLHMKITGDTRIDCDDKFNLNVASDTAIESGSKIGIKSSNDTAIDAGSNFGVKAGSAAIIKSSSTSGWDCGATLNFKGSTIGLNSGGPGGPAGPVAPEVPTPPEDFTLLSQNDTIKEGDIWKHINPSEHTDNSILDKIPTHEPYLSREDHIIPLVSQTGQPSKKV